MKIPKSIDKLIDRRERLAEELNEADIKLCDWMESKGMNLCEMGDFTRTGCMVYCEPATAARCVRESIEEYNG